MDSPKRVLVSEGSSLSARESITALGLAGHRVGVCDPDPLCLGRFSRFVERYYRCPAFAKDPWAYFDFVLGLLTQGAWDVLFPTHEQAFLFSREREHIPSGIGFAIADFQSFLQIQGKVALVRTLHRLSIPQPPSHVIESWDQLLAERRFPFYLKADYGTASTAVWRIDSLDQLESEGLFDGKQEFVVQEVAQGPIERVQAVFDRGRLAAIHGYRQVLAGLGGGDIAKLSVSRPAVREYMERLGLDLQWHGALSMDYVFQEETRTPLFIDANPRLVEPMSGVLSGINLADVLVRISTGEPITIASPQKTEVRTHMLLMALLSAGASRKRRLDVVFELARALRRTGLYRSSQEELLPIRTDFKSIFPLTYALTKLLLSPGSALTLSARSIASYSLSPAAAQQIAGSRPKRART